MSKHPDRRGLQAKQKNRRARFTLVLVEEGLAGSKHGSLFMKFGAPTSLFSDGGAMVYSTVPMLQHVFVKVPFRARRVVVVHPDKTTLYWLYEHTQRVHSPGKATDLHSQFYSVLIHLETEVACKKYSRLFPCAPRPPLPKASTNWLG